MEKNKDGKPHRKGKYRGTDKTKIGGGGRKTLTEKMKRSPDERHNKLKEHMEI